jgi:protein O-GlcNAc transferase
MKKPLAQQLQGEIDRLITLYNRGQLADVVDQCGMLIGRFPRSAMLYNILGAAAIGLKDFAVAEEAYVQAAALDPNNAELYNNHGITLSALAKLPEAVAAFRRALVINPRYAEAHYNLGNALRKQNASEPAITAYKNALAIAPNDADTYNNLGLAYRDQGRHEEALAAYGQALKLRPKFVDALHNLGVLLMERKDFGGAIKAYSLALAIDPDKADARGQLLYAKAHICDFSVYDDYAAQLAAGRLQPGQVSPFTMLVFADDPAHQLAYSRAWPGSQSKPVTLPVRARTENARIKIGYFSADFHDHATMWLMAGLFREHDRQRFEIFAYSYGPSCESALRTALIRDIDHFIDIKDMTDADAVALARSHELDIAIDLKGYTQHSRSRLFVPRVAPVQMNYLGYPGSMGADFIDYLVADKTVVPSAERQFYSENIAYLPGSYQPNDDRRPILDNGTTRRDLALPEDGFVFCCFNQTYKISPREFAIWMRLLDKVPGSVLWLLRSNEWAEANLRREATMRGIDPARLVFAAPLPHTEHLGRLHHADLFLDTFNVNAHTTASDALWGGLPVLTLAGRQFAARVCASLVKAVGLPELVTDTEGDYEACAMLLATKPDLLRGYRELLAANRSKSRLFDTVGYTRRLEAMFVTVHDRQVAQLAPMDVAIDLE